MLVCILRDVTSFTSNWYTSPLLSPCCSLGKPRSIVSLALRQPQIILCIKVFSIPFISIATKILAFPQLASISGLAVDAAMKCTSPADIVSRLRYPPTLLTYLRRVAMVLAQCLSAVVSLAVAKVMDVRIPSALSLGRRRQQQDHITACDGYFQGMLIQDRRIMMKMVASAIIASLGHEGLAFAAGLLSVPLTVNILNTTHEQGQKIPFVAMSYKLQRVIANGWSRSGQFRWLPRTICMLERAN